MKLPAILLVASTCFHCYDVISANDNDRRSCRIRPADREAVQYLRDSIMYIFEIQYYNETLDPLRNDVSRTYKPWKWYRTTSGHGKTLLTLSFNYDVLSLTILTIGVERVPLKIKDNPEGCFLELTPEERVQMIQDKVFDNFKRRKSRRITNMTADEEHELDLKQPELIYVCNEVVRDENGYADFANRCCARDSSGDVTCTEQEDNFWITVLYICIGLVKLMLFMFAPLLVPAHMYTASYVASEYVVKLTKELKMKMYVSEGKATSVRATHTLSSDQISDWHRFRESIEMLPMDQICHVKVPELRIKVKGKRIIPANEPPTGLLRTFYDNLIRCKIRRLDPFKDCCNTSVYGPRFESLFIKYACTWEDLTLIFIKIVVLLLVPLPYYLRVFIYYKFEADEFDIRRALLKELGLKQAFNPFRSNLIQHHSPTHGIFIATYSFYIISGIVIGFSADGVRDKLKSIVRSAFSDMQNVSRTNVLQIILGFLLWPFRKLGLLALISCPIVGVVTAPVWSTVFILYCVPTVYLGYRLIYHCKKKLGSEDSMFESDKPLSKAKMRAYKMKKKLTKIDKGVHLTRQSIHADEDQSPCVGGFGRLAALRRFLFQVLTSLFCLIVLFSSVLLFVEAVGVIVEVLVFTMMGIIVNAGSTLRYVSMALLVIVYMHNCYDNVYDNYLTFNNTVIEDVMDKVDDLKKVASLPSSMQENFAFQVKPVEAVDEIPTTFYLDKKEPQWKIGHLLMFLDSNDTPRIPLNLFKKLCEVRVHGAPGPVYINLLKATGKFSIIVVFLFFVMIVVMAFGSAHQMSSTNQTLATLAGGFVPMLLKNVLSSKGTKLNLKTLSFKGQIDEIVAEYKQSWPIYDLVVESYDPEAEERERREKEEAEKNADDKSSDNKTDDKDSNDNEKSKDDGAEKKKDVIVNKNLAHLMNSDNLSLKSFLSPNDAFNTSEEDLRPMGTNRPEYMRRLSICPVEDNTVDLFIDIQSPDIRADDLWEMSGSINSMHSIAMYRPADVKYVDDRMPYDPNPDGPPPDYGYANARGHIYNA